MKAVGVFPASREVKLVEVRALITGRYPIEAFGDLVFGNPRGIKNVIALL